MIGHFQGSSRPRSGSPPAAARPRPVSPPAVARPHPLTALFAQLRGRQVAVVAGSREVRGRVLSPDPVILVDERGTVRLVPWDQIQSVQY